MNYHAFLILSFVSSMALADQSILKTQKDVPPPRADESPERTEARERVAKDHADLNQKLKEGAPTAEIHGVKTRLQRDRTFENKEDVKQQMKEKQRAEANQKERDAKSNRLTNPQGNSTRDLYDDTK
ncbi:hypothetical protein [Bdellovibrio sp. HCB209]|uniref:hypothetical protein n=1 Tax=Bdellovibrio sp. HCB209 TaxID=3394354 RepID=UPI0039B67B37